MKTIKIMLVIKEPENFCLPAFTGTIEGYTNIKILAAEQKAGVDQHKDRGDLKCHH